VIPHVPGSDLYEARRNSPNPATVTLVYCSCPLFRKPLFPVPFHLHWMTSLLNQRPFSFSCLFLDSPFPSSQFRIFWVSGPPRSACFWINPGGLPKQVGGQFFFFDPSKGFHLSFLFPVTSAAPCKAISLPFSSAGIFIGACPSS